jgi:hypothetical protein
MPRVKLIRDVRPKVAGTRHTVEVDRGTLLAEIERQLSTMRLARMPYVRTTLVKDYVERRRYLIVEGWKEHPGSYGPAPRLKDIS